MSNPTADPSDPNAEKRKEDHIKLALQSRVLPEQLDRRFDYEPLLAAHPGPEALEPRPFLGYSFRVPMWVSSMTGGTARAGHINRNLARACAEFGFGMGLGSCRQLLSGDQHFADFDVRPILGAGLPLYANLGVAQVQTLLSEGKAGEISRLISRLHADGLIIHINPLQEWLQPEGDRYQRPPLETILEALEVLDCPLIVKEVGQGMGPASLKALLQAPLAAIDFAAHGGTNFSMLELLRGSASGQEFFGPLTRIGHSAAEMVDSVNKLLQKPELDIRCRQIIISGGIGDFLDGFYLTQKLQLPSVFGMASAFLRHAQGDYSELQAYVRSQVEGFALAQSLLRVRS